jgi:hypothetical protein
MRSRSLGRGLLAVAVGLAVVTGLARAQDPPPAAPSNPSGTYGASPYYTAPPPAPEEASNSWLHTHLNRFGHHCAATVNSYGCGSWKADCTFAFGSCRAFFGEPCYPDNTPAHQGLGTVYQTQSRGGCGCR